MASHRLSETYRQSKRELGGAAQSSKSKASKGAVARQSNSVETTGEEQAQKLLRQFDLTAKYGPCTDVSRRQRWERASKLGLDPPQGVLQALEQLDASHPEQQGIWADRT